MQTTEKVPIVRKYGITVYVMVIDSKGKLGQFEVHTYHAPSVEYATFKEAEKRFNELCYIAEKLGSQGLRSHLQK